MVAGGITEACLWQSAVLMGDLKTAYLVQASPRVTLMSQLLGSLIGCFVGSGVYRLFIIIYDIPNTRFPIPLAHMWARTARLVQGGDFPDGVGPFLVAGLVLSAILRFCTSTLAGRRWATWIPSGVAMSIGKRQCTCSLLPPLIICRNVRPTVGDSREIYWSRITALLGTTLGCFEDSTYVCRHWLHFERGSTRFSALSFERPERTARS